MSDGRWEPGTHVTGRGIWFGRVFAAWPFVVVEETDDLVVTYIPPGTVWKRPADLAGNDMRLPHGEWGYSDDVWRGHGLIRILVREAAHSVLVFLGRDDVAGWYINLEDPFVKTPIGFDTRDHHLDLVFTSDLTAHRWKDEHELDEAVAYGSVSPAEAAAVRAEGERAIESIRSGEHPAVDDRWRSWTPDPVWGIPELAQDWESHPTHIRD